MYFEWIRMRHRRWCVLRILNESPWISRDIKISSLSHQSIQVTLGKYIGRLWGSSWSNRLLEVTPLRCYYLLTYSTVQSPSWEANWFVADQEIPRISRNPKIHYRTHNRPPPVSILGQPNPVHIPTSHLLEIHPNIIHPSTTRSPQWSPSLLFPHQDPTHPHLLTHTRHSFHITLLSEN